MRSTIIRWAIYLFALLVAGPAVGMLVGSVHAVDGGPASPLVSSAPALSLAAAIGALVVALLIGLVTARILGLAPALTAAGLVVAWAAWKTADNDQLVRTAQSGSPLVKLAVEGAILGIFGLAIIFTCWMFSRHEGIETSQKRRSVEERLIAAVLIKMFAGKGGAVSIVVGAAAAAVAAWLIGISPLKGQAVFAAIVAGTFSAAACRLVDFESPIPTMFLPLALLAIVGPLTGLALSGSAGVVAATYKGSLFPLANISPLDWIAGGLLGIPIGVSWAGSMIEKRHPEPSPVAASSSRK